MTLKAKVNVITSHQMSFWQVKITIITIILLLLKSDDLGVLGQITCTPVHPLITNTLMSIVAPRWGFTRATCLDNGSFIIGLIIGYYEK